MAADAVESFTAVDFAAPLRGYVNRFGAMRNLLRQGHRDVISYLDSLFERTDRPRTGDVIALPGADGPLDPLAIADGRGCVWAQDRAGLVRLALPQDVVAWSV